MNRLKELREKKNIPQKVIAAVAEVSTATVSRWESGEFLPRADKLPALAKTLGCSIDELLEESAANES